MVGVLWSRLRHDPIPELSPWGYLEMKELSVSPGRDILMKVAGKDGTSMFSMKAAGFTHSVDKYHQWVNLDSLMSKCMIGMYDSEEEEVPLGSETTSQLDALD